MWMAQADVLKLAKTKEQRERIKWFHARRTFFSKQDSFSRDPRWFAEGLALAKLCDHDDARFLVSLFPGGPPANQKEAKAVFLALGV